MKQIFKQLVFTTICLLAAFGTYAQVTTGGVSGVVRDSRGGPLPGATVKITHGPSGTVYHTATRNNGGYSIAGIRVGSDYNIEFYFMGYNTHRIGGITVTLGDPVKIDATLEEESMKISDLVVFGEKASAFNKERTGAATNISSREMSLVPSLNRSLSDYTKLSPYSTGSGSFGGRDAYMTNVTIDGANFNNNFGLSTGSMPGASGEPISMEAIEEMQVVIAPFDVRQSNFTSAGVNAVTKGGSNTFRGSVYGFFRNQELVGVKIKDKEVTRSESSRRTLGLSLGGPIIKNKLFFYVNGEMDNNLTPGNTLLALAPGRDPSKDNNVNTTVQAADLDKFSKMLDSKFGYKTGRYENWGSDDTYNNKVLARLDWNISNSHKFTVRYNYSASSSISRPSSSGDANPSINTTRHGRTGGMSFENTQYYTESKLHSITGELHSQFGARLSNHLLVAYTSYDQPRSSDSDLFPMIDIMRGNVADQNPYMSAGYELFSYNNRVKNNTLILTDNVTISLGQHSITAGLSYENQYFANSYLRQGTGYYRFKDLASFERYINGEGNGKAYNSDYHPVNFAYTYPINGHTDPASELSFGQFSAYVQDEWNMLSNLKVTYGLRVDLPMYLDGALDNPLTHGLEFRDGETIDLGSWPKTQLLWSPRLGFNWDVFKNRRLTVRGGSGIFTGRLPFVWFTNQPTNSGMLQYQLVINQNGGTAAQSKLARIPFATDVSTLLKNQSLSDIFPTKNVASGRLAAVDKDFKLPQVWRSSLAFDIKLPLDMMLSLEGIYSRDINTVWFDNINIKDPDAKIVEGDSQRDYYTNRLQYVVTGSYSDVIVMRNTGLGQSVSFAASLDLPHIYGFGGNIAYSYNYADEVTGKNGSDPYSAWRYRQSVNALNSREMGLTMNNTPHRFIASLDYHIDYAKYFGTTVSLFYRGYTGDAYSYTYTGAVMNDGGVATSLMYIPKDKSDVIWKNGDADWTAYQEFVSNDKYLQDNSGAYMMRYDAHLPWNSQFDFRFIQDFKLKVGKTYNKLQFTMDIINVENLLNKDWGIVDNLNGSNRAYQLLKYEGRDAATGKAIVSMNKKGSDSVRLTPSNTSATWAIQFGLRYNFN